MNGWMAESAVVAMKRVTIVERRTGGQTKRNRDTMTVLSIDRINSGKTKLERLSDRAVMTKDTVFNNLGHIVDKSLLLELFHRMKGRKAVGIDRIDKASYGLALDSNIDALLKRLRSGTYIPKPAKIVEIPKEDGSKRPLAVSCLEDKLVQAAVSQILTKIYEPIFLPCSYGFRPGKSCHDALRALYKHSYPCFNGAVIEIDIRKYFNSIPHNELRKMLQKKITDQRFLKLIDKLATAPVLQEGKIEPNTIGCPQGSILSPVLANIFLHEVIDAWFHTIRRAHFRGTAEIVRYADDMVFIFEHYADAKRFFEVLPKRLKKYGLDMHMEKSSLIRSGQNAAEQAHKVGQRLPTYKFLGFTVYWGKARGGKWWRMKVRSRRDRFQAKLQGLKTFLRNNLGATSTEQVLSYVAWVTKGWINYHAVSDNHKMVHQFMNISRRSIKRWINRRGRKRPMNWETCNRLLEEINFPSDYKTINLFSRS